ncbi:MAG: cytochrome c3 family protein [Gammaproteobacteria bacterium]|nr:cytochrome c3 family protein [Gammaproteobacteria bacterium]
MRRRRHDNSTAPWSPVLRVDHLEVVGTCFSCHDNSTAPGKQIDHIQSSDTCDDCHTTNAWTPATFDHTGIVNGCVTCHSIGHGATPKTPDHITTSDNCEACHSTLIWAPAILVDHDEVQGTCMSCHNGDTAPGKGNGHFITTQDCDTCHTVISWVPINFTHSSGNYPGDHRRNLGCQDCHQTNAETIPWPSPGLAPFCAGCHESDFRSGPHLHYESNGTRYTIQEIPDCTGSCHVYASPTNSTITDFRSNQHRVNASGF